MFHEATRRGLRPHLLTFGGRGLRGAAALKEKQHRRSCSGGAAQPQAANGKYLIGQGSRDLRSNPGRSAGRFGAASASLLRPWRVVKGQGDQREPFGWGPGPAPATLPWPPGVHRAESSQA